MHKFNRLLYLFFLCIFVLGTTNTIWGQTTGKIAGNITDAETGEPLLGVNLVVEGMALGAATDAEGDYYIINVPSGTYNLTAIFIGYQSVTKTGVLVSVNNTTPINFELTATALELDVIMVVAEKEIISMDQSSSIISSTIEEIQAVPAMDNVLEFLNLQAGIENDLVRGGGLDQTGFTVDGLMLVDNRVNEPIFMVNLSSIKEVNIIKGGFNAEYGNVRSGLINVVTKEGEVTDYNASIDFRYSPSRLKHSGASLFSPDNFYLRPYLDPEVMWEGTANGGWDEATQNRYPSFEGWDALASRLNTDDDPSNDLTPEQARDLFLWQHRAEGSGDLGQKEGKYGESPDWNMDLSLSGPVPFVKDLTFFASHKTTREAFGLPVSREYYKEGNSFLKFTTRLSPTMKLSVQGLYGEIETVARAVDEPLSNDYVRSGSDIFYTDLAEGDAYGDRAGNNLYWPSSLAPFDIFRSMQGVSFDHTLSPSTFYNIRISHTRVKNLATGPDRWRDTTTVRYFGNTPVDEAPYGFWWEGGNKKMFDGMVYNAIGAGARDRSETNNLNIKFDITSQFNKHNQLKAGVIFDYDDFNTDYEKVSEYAKVDEIRTRWRYYPLRLGAYVQDKLEFEGMIANLGVRLDYNNPNTKWFGGDAYSEVYSAKYKDVFSEIATKQNAESYVKVSPRLGISHPISENAKMYFNYGHFYSMPTSNDMFAIQYGKAAQGVTFIGNASADIPRTIAYELGFEYDISDMFLLHLAGYYKDVSNQTGTVAYTNYDGTVDYQTIQNNNYADIRGFEISLQKRFGSWITGWANYNYILTTSGFVGREHYYQDVRLQRIEGLQNPIQEKPLARPYANANIMLNSPEDWGPEFAGIKPFGGVSFSLLFSWKAGQYVTWDPLETFQLKQNLQWRDRYNFDARISKRVDIGRYSISFFADISNLFNNNYISMQGFENDEDLRNYYNSLHLPQYNGAEYKAQGFTGGDDKPGDVKSKDKPYIDMPNRGFLTYLDERFVTFGIKFNF